MVNSCFVIWRYIYAHNDRWILLELRQPLNILILNSKNKHSPNSANRKFENFKR